MSEKEAARDMATTNSLSPDIPGEVLEIVEGL